MPNRKFEIVSKYQNAGLTLPTRSTQFSAGYDFTAAEDKVVPSIWNYVKKIDLRGYTDEEKLDFLKYAVKPTLVSTGIKASMPAGNALFLYNRSSNPLKRGLILANGVGVVDSDYYNNPDNEGEIFAQFLNVGTHDYKIKKGDKILQGIFQNYFLVENDQAHDKRLGGLGSTGK